MKFDPQKHHRRSIRMRDFDYSLSGAYFITIVTHERKCLFGKINDSSIYLDKAGLIVWEVWNSLPERYPQIILGSAVVMPNHFHGIVMINEMDANVGAIHELPLPGSADARAIHESPLQRRRMTLPLVVGYFKMNTAKRINEILDSHGAPIWQRNYYEHIIRDEGEHDRIHGYIDANIANWVTDEENPIRQR